MTDQTVGSPGAQAQDAGVIWNRAIFDDLRTILGEAKTDTILSNFWLDLCRRFESHDDGELLRRDAHVVKSTAGLLGFESLGEAARSLEAACLDSRPFKPFAETLDVRRREVGEALSSR